MKKRYKSKNSASGFILFLFLIFCCLINIDCFTEGRKIIQMDTTDKPINKKIYWAVLRNGSSVVFSRTGGEYINRRPYKTESQLNEKPEYIAGETPDLSYIEIPLKDVSEMQIEKLYLDIGSSILLAFWILVILSGVWFPTWLSFGFLL
jgi:hypothetical protein